MPELEEVLFTGIALEVNCVLKTPGFGTNNRFSKSNSEISVY